MDYTKEEKLFMRMVGVVGFLIAVGIVLALVQLVDLMRKIF